MKLFKIVCNLKGYNGMFGIGQIDQHGTKSIILFDGTVVPSNHIEYKGRAIKDSVLYRLSPATCGHTTECTIGNPKLKCVQDGLYAENKCAVYFIYEINDVSDFHFDLTIAELRVLMDS